MSHHKFILAAGSLAFASAVTAPAQAATLLGVFGGNDCTGGFSACFATQTGINVADGELPSPVVTKYDGGLQLDEISTNYPSIDGSEFFVGFDLPSTVSFTYTPGLADPDIHYFAIKQGNQYALYYDADPILSDMVDLSGVGFSAGSDSFSHITFFNSGSTPAVPEPTTWAMMLFGFGAIGFAMRRRKDKTVTRRLHVSYN